MGDFNINLLNYDNDTNVANFLDSLTSTSLLPYITQPTRITPKSKTLIDNIFSSNLTLFGPGYFGVGKDRIRPLITHEVVMVSLTSLVD